MNGDVLVIDGQEGAVRGKVMPHHVNIRLFASHAYCSDSSKKVYSKYPSHDHSTLCSDDLEVRADITVTLIADCFFHDSRRRQRTMDHSWLHLEPSSKVNVLSLDVNINTLHYSFTSL